MNKLARPLFKVLDVIVIFMMIFGAPGSALAQVWTDPLDYPPGSTVTIHGDNNDADLEHNWLAGEPIVVDVVGPNGYTAQCEADAGAEGVWACDIVLWDNELAVGEYVYTATGAITGNVESGVFTDAPGSINKVYQHWSDEPAPGNWNGDILNANKANYFEGEVVPHVFVYKASNNAPLTNGQSYAFNVTYNYYQSNTNAGGFAYMTTYNISRQPAPLNATNPYIPPSPDATFANGGGMQGSFYTVDADITNVSAVTHLGTSTLDGYVTVTFTYTGVTTTNGIAEIYYGLFIAAPGQVPPQGRGTTKGASTWTGGSLQTTVDIGGSGATSIQLNPAGIIAGQISGVKFSDTDGDGVKDAGEPLLPNWTIILDSDSDPNNGYITTVQTDASGAYSFSVTPDANKLTPANDPYYVHELQQATWTQTAPATIYYGPLTVTAATPTYLNQDFGNKPFVAAPAMNVVKTADPLTLNEPGGTVTFTVRVNNTGNVELTIDALSDDIYGDLNGQGTCAVPQTIAAATGYYECSFDGSVAGNAGDIQTDTVTATAGTLTAFDDATVTIVDVAAAMHVVKTAGSASDNSTFHINEPGGDVQFFVTVYNDSTVDSITIDTLSDDIYGNLNTQGTCTVPQTLAVGASYSCAFYGAVGGNAGDSQTDVVTASGKDDDGKAVSDTDDAVVTLDDVAPTLTVDKTANPTTLPEPGGPVEFTVVVTNTSDEDVTLTTLSDDVYGDLNGQGTCATGGTIAAGGSYTCAFPANVTGEPADYTDTVTAVVTDNDNTTATGHDDATVTITNVLPSVLVDKTADPESLPEPGGPVEFTVVVTNTSAEDVTLTSLDDDVYGDLNGKGTCVTGGTVAAGGTYTCAFTANVTGEPGNYTDTVTAVVTDNDQTTASDDDDATVAIQDVLPLVDLVKDVTPLTLPEPGGVFTYTLTITNNSVEPVTIASLTDDNALSVECLALVGTTLAIGASANCSYTITHTEAGSYPNTATVGVTDNEGNPASDSDSKTVRVTDVPPDITITKTADPEIVPETGGDVTFTFLVTNEGVEPVTLTSLTDTVFGDLNGQGNCLTGGTIAVGGSYTCSITVKLSSDSLTAHNNVVTAVGTDNEGSTDGASDDATVDFSDVVPIIRITKTASYNGVTPAVVPESGGNVTFTFLVENIGPEDVTLTALTDTVLGDLNGKGTCVVPQTILIGSSYSCEYTVSLSSDDLTAHKNIATATAVDDDNTPASDDDDETVTFEDQLPSITVEKTASPTSVNEPGGNVLFTFRVTNTSPEAVTITSLTDTAFTLTGDTDCQVGTVLAVGGWCEFTQTEFIAGDASDPDHSNTFTGVAEDNDGNTATGSDDATVGFDDVLPTILVGKSALPTQVNEPGGLVIFTVTVENTSVELVTLTALVDDVYGDLLDDASNNNISNSTCTAGNSLAMGATYTCSFTAGVYGDALSAHTDTVTGTATDNEGNAATDTGQATVSVLDVLPSITVLKTASPTSVNEPGGNVTFTFKITNTSVEPVTITSLSDTDFTLTGDADCQVGTVLPVGGWCEFNQTEFIAGDASDPDHNNTFTAHAEDNENNDASGSDDATVGFDDVAPSITVLKTANPTMVLETGGDVEFTFKVTNTSSEPVTITSLSDSVFGTLAGDADCQLGTVLAVSGSCEFAQTEFIGGSYDASATHNNTFTAHAEDNEKNDASGSDDATVGFEDLAPSITVEKTANPTSVPETGANVEFTFKVTNTSSEPVTVTSLSDNVFGTLAGDADCQVGTVLAVSGSCEFTQIEFIDGDYESAATHSNTFTAHAQDNEKNDASDSDDASVNITNVTANIDIEKYVSVDGGATWLDADSATGPKVLVGSNVKFKFVVTNNSEVALSNLSLTDSVFSLSGCTKPASLAAGASFDCIISATALGDQHKNTGTAAGSFTDGNGNTESDTDSDDANYFGANPQIAIVKVTNGSDGPTIITGTTVTWKYTVTNVGNVPLSNVTVTDSHSDVTPAYLSGDTNADGILDLTETWIYEASGTAIVGAYSNIGTASGSYTDDAAKTGTDTATDPSSYTGKVQVNVIKTVNGAAFSGPDLTFQLRQGAAPVSGQVGTVLDTQIAGVANNGHVTFSTLLAVGTYQLCEFVPDGYVPSYIWGTYGVDWFKPGYAPDQGGLDPLILVCVNFTVNADGTINFQNGQQTVQPGGSIMIDNQVGQMPLTIGFWKNHASARGSNGGQDFILDQMLYELTQSGHTLQIGTLLLPGGSTANDAGTSALWAVRLLNKSTISTGKKMASDPCFNVAAQLVAYRLNQPNGAWPSTVAALAADTAQQILVAKGFNGNTHGKLSAKDIANLNYLAKVLDAYNNSTLTITTLTLPYPAAVNTFVLTATQWTTGPSAVSGQPGRITKVSAR